MVRPGDLTGHSDFHLFKEGIKPMWEVRTENLGPPFCLFSLALPRLKYFRASLKAASLFGTCLEQGLQENALMPSLICAGGFQVVSS